MIADRELTDAELEMIYQAVDVYGDGDRYIAAIIAVYETLDPDWHDREPPISPGDYRIPAEQSTLILERCSIGVESLAAANGLLDWMNKGPSSREKVE